MSIITKADQMYDEVELKVDKAEHDVNVFAGGQVLTDTIAKPEAPDGEKKD